MKNKSVVDLNSVIKGRCASRPVSPFRTIILFIGLMSGLGAVAQIAPMPVFTIENDSRQYGEIIQPPSLVFNLENGRIWMVLQKMSPDSSLSTTANKIAIQGDGGGPIDPTPTFDYIKLTPLSGLPSGQQGQICILDDPDEGQLLYIYQDNDWYRYFPLNRPLNGVTFSINN